MSYQTDLTDREWNLIRHHFEYKMPLRYLVWVAGKMFGILNSNLAPIK